MHCVRANCARLCRSILAKSGPTPPLIFCIFSACVCLSVCACVCDEFNKPHSGAHLRALNACVLANTHTRTYRRHRVRHKIARSWNVCDVCLCVCVTCRVCVYMNCTTRRDHLCLIIGWRVDCGSGGGFLVCAFVISAAIAPRVPPLSIYPSLPPQYETIYSSKKKPVRLWCVCVDFCILIRASIFGCTRIPPSKRNEHHTNSSAGAGQ